MAGLFIRKAAAADSARIAGLVSELGYPTSAGEMARRLTAILEDADYDTLVALDNGGIVGFIGTRIGLLYEADGFFGQIVAVAVAAGHQRHGVGRALMRMAESRLAERGARVLVVASGNHRVGAHAFYENCGYSFTGRRYKKVVERSA